MAPTRSIGAVATPRCRARALLFALACCLAGACHQRGATHGSGSGSSTSSGSASAAGPAAARLVKREHAAMGTTMHIGVYTRVAAKAERSIAAAFAEIDRLERLLSSWRPGSQTSQLNAAAGKSAVKLGDELLAVLRAGLRGSRATGGAFDVTFKPLSRLWRIKREPHPPPSDAAIEAARKLVDYRDVIIDAARKTAQLRRVGQLVDLGGVGKGYAVDRAVAVLRRRGHRHFFLQAGGDLYFAGRRGTRRWRAGIRDPRGPQGSYFASLEIEDRTCSTSGDYERFFMHEGRRYHHIIDPRTGRPARASRSVTIIAKSATSADWLSTGAFILGPKRALAMIEKMPDVEAAIVDADNKVHLSSGLKGRLTILRQPTK